MLTVVLHLVSATSIYNLEDTAFKIFVKHCKHCIIQIILFYVSSGFEKPSAIQQRAIAPILEGRDVIAQSQVHL